MYIIEYIPKNGKVLISLKQIHSIKIILDVIFETVTLKMIRDPCTEVGHSLEEIIEVSLSPLTYEQDFTVWKASDTKFMSRDFEDMYDCCFWCGEKLSEAKIYSKHMCQDCLEEEHERQLEKELNVYLNS